MDAGGRRSCWRHSPTELNSRISASSAFLPFHGSDDACAWRPVEHDVDVLRGERLALDVAPVARVVQQGRVDARRTGRRRSSICLPLPRSSAGVPRKTISPGSSSATAARAIAAPTPDAAIVLWPQPWPRPGSASYSARIPIRGPSPPRPPRRTARIAVARLPAGCSTSNPCRASTSATQAGGLVLLEGRLRVGVDPMRQLEDLVAGGLDGGGQPGLGVGVGLGRAGGGQRRQRCAPGWGWLDGASLASTPAGTRPAACAVSVPPRGSPRPPSARAIMNSAIGSRGRPAGAAPRGPRR